jgi:hypothetical protein
MRSPELATSFFVPSISHSSSVTTQVSRLDSTIAPPIVPNQFVPNQSRKSSRQGATSYSLNSAVAPHRSIDRLRSQQNSANRRTNSKKNNVSSRSHPRERSGALFETVPIFNINANFNSSQRFYNIPYPSDLRLDANGNPNLSGFPISELSPIAKDLRSIASDRPGFPTTSAAYFRFSSPLAPQDPTKLLPRNPNASIFLVDVDPDSPERGRLFPVVAATPNSDSYAPPFLLGVAPSPGIVLHPDRTYAYVVRRSLKDALGKPLGVSNPFKTLREDNTPAGELGAKTRQLYRPLWQTLDGLGVDRQSVVTATVFTTGDVVADTARLSQQVVDRYNLSIDNLQVVTDSQPRSGFIELRGTIRYPQFQKGVPPFDRDGLFQFAPNGTLIEQRREVAPVVITIPTQRMPQGGYPLMMYFHGSNGLSTQMVDRGPITKVGGQPTPRKGPGFVVAQAGFAAVSSALPLNPERLPGGPEDAYRNVKNLAAYRDNLRQGVFEQRLLLEALGNLRIPAALLENVPGVALPAGETEYRFQTASTMALGQSLGAQYANMIAAVEPKIRTVVPTGSGGFLSLLIAENQFAPVVGLALGTIQPLNYLHPSLHLLQTAWETADSLPYMPRLARRPLPNHPVRSIYMPIGQGDLQIPQPVANASALATGLQQAGQVLNPELQRSLMLENFAGIATYPVSNNRISETGIPYTGVVVQYAGDGITDPHNIFAQLSQVKSQYTTFFGSALTTGIAILPAPFDRA